jgi:hypothetical protein
MEIETMESIAVMDRSESGPYLTMGERYSSRLP